MQNTNREFQAGDLVLAKSPLWSEPQISVVISPQQGLEELIYYWVEPADKSLPRGYSLAREMDLICPVIKSVPVFRLSVCPSTLPLGDFIW